MSSSQGFQAASILPPGPTPCVRTAAHKARDKDKETSPELKTALNESNMHAGIKAKIAEEFEQWDVTGYSRVTATRRRVHIYAQV